MNKNIDKNNLNEVIRVSKKILKLLYIILIGLGIYILLKLLKETNFLLFLLSIIKILSPLFLGIVVAWLLNPFVRLLEKKNIRRTLGTIVAYVILLGCIFLLVKAIIPLIYDQTIELADNIPNIFSDIKDWFQNLFKNINSTTLNVNKIESSLFKKFDDISNSLTTSAPSAIINILSTVISSIGTFIIGLVIGFYLLLSYNNLNSVLIDIFPNKIRKTGQELFKKIDISLKSYVTGALLDAFIVFIVSSIVFAILGLKAPLLFGLFCGLMNVIPYAGPYIGGAPAVIVAFSQSTGVGIAILISIIIIQTIEGNILQTLIISKTTKLNPVTIIIGLLIFGHFFGILGMLLSTPLIGVLKVIVKFFDEKYDILNFN